MLIELSTEEQHLVRRCVLGRAASIIENDKLSSEYKHEANIECMDLFVKLRRIYEDSPEYEVNGDD